MFKRFRKSTNNRRADNDILTTVPGAYSIPSKDWKSFKTEAINFLKRTKPDEANYKYFDANITSEWQLEWSELFKQKAEREHTKQSIIAQYDYYSSFISGLKELLVEEEKKSE